MRTEPFRTVTRFAAVLVMTATMGSVVAQYDRAPFIDRPLETSHAFGLELIAARLIAAEELDPVPADYVDELEELLESDYRRFAGTLSERDSELASAFEASLAGLVDAAATGDSLAPRLDEIRELHARAYEVLIGEERAQEPDFRAAVLADLLLGEDGVAEAYEEAAEEEIWQYANGWGALERVKQVWSGLSTQANETKVADFEEMVSFLEDVVYPRAEPPEGGIRGDPEEAEAATQRMVGILETIANADLYAGRDLGRLADTFLTVLEPACAAYEAGDDQLGVEGIYAVRDPYRKHLRRLLDLIAPQIHEPAVAHLDALISDDPPADPAQACRELQELLSEARAMV